MTQAIEALQQAGTPMDANWGSLQVAADRGASPIGIGGGSHAAGNANALSSVTPEQNSNAYRPVTYGSSHIQAVTFTATGVDARTILTYSQSENTRSQWSQDQTRMFADAQWVRFPFTAPETADQQEWKRDDEGGWTTLGHDGCDGRQHQANFTAHS